MRNFFFAESPYLETNPATFWIRSPGWRIWICKEFGIVWMVEYTMTLKTQIQSLPRKYSTWLLNEMLSLLLENNNDHNQVFWARETQHLQQTIVLTKTAGQQPGSGHCFLRSSLLLSPISSPESAFLLVSTKNAHSCHFKLMRNRSEDPFLVTVESGDEIVLPPNRMPYRACSVDDSNREKSSTRIRIRSCIRGQIRFESEYVWAWTLLNSQRKVAD